MDKKSDGDVKSAKFQISAALFEELGERLVSRPEIALAELIKNSYDADATECRVVIADDQVTVIDDGHGLTESDFLNNWMVVSSTNKAKRRHSRLYQRSMAGSKGVGRFSARFLGTVLDLESTAKDEVNDAWMTLTASFNWVAISKQQDVSDIVIQYTIKPARVGKTGTTLVIRSLREHVADLPEDRVRTDVLRLVDADGGLEKPSFTSTKTKSSQDPGFRVVFPTGGNSGAQETNLADSILSKYVARARVSVDEDGTVDFRIFWRGHDKAVERRSFKLARLARPYTAKALLLQDGEKDDRGLPVELRAVDHLPLATELNGPVFMDLRFFPKRPGTFANLPLNGTKAQAWVKANSGIAVVDNGFAMSAYADENSDWLALEASKSSNERNWQSVFTPNYYAMDPADKSDPARNPMLALPRVSQIIGRVHISTRKAAAGVDDDDWLLPNMDREQLRNNGAYRLLWHLVRFTLETIAHFDRKFRLEEEEARNEEARQKARLALSATIKEIKASPQIASEHKTVMLRQLREVEEQFTIAEGYDRSTRVSLEMMAMMGVMAGFMTHEFDKALEALHDAGDKLRMLAKRHPELRSGAEFVLKKEKVLAEQAEYMRLYVGAARKLTILPFKAKSQLVAATKTVGVLAEEHGIDIQIDVDPKLPGPSVPLAAYHGLIINLTSNAMKALVARAGNERRIIKIYAVNDDTKHVLVCADNGIGVPEYLRERIWDPLFTTTEGADESNPLNSGLGLGLAVVKRVVEGVGGKIELMKAAPPGFSTAFRIVLPLEKD